MPQDIVGVQIAVDELGIVCVGERAADTPGRRSSRSPVGGIPV
jgi:hypothetical protein